MNMDRLLLFMTTNDQQTNWLIVADKADHNQQQQGFTNNTIQLHLAQFRNLYQHQSGYSSTNDKGYVHKPGTLGDHRKLGA